MRLEAFRIKNPEHSRSSQKPISLALPVPSQVFGTTRVAWIGAFFQSGFWLQLSPKFGRFWLYRSYVGRNLPMAAFVTVGFMNQLTGQCSVARCWSIFVASLICGLCLLAILPSKKISSIGLGILNPNQFWFDSRGLFTLNLSFDSIEALRHP